MWRSLSGPLVRVKFDAGFYNELEAANRRIIIRNSTGLIIGTTCLWNRYVQNALVGTQANTNAKFKYLPMLTQNSLAHFLLRKGEMI